MLGGWIALEEEVGPPGAWWGRGFCWGGVALLVRPRRGEVPGCRERRGGSEGVGVVLRRREGCSDWGEEGEGCYDREKGKTPRLVLEGRGVPLWPVGRGVPLWPVGR